METGEPGAGDVKAANRRNRRGCRLDGEIWVERGRKARRKDSDDSLDLATTARRANGRENKVEL